ncbi:MAG: GyrI-like domain-containing protein [Prevotella sp.]|nr:GyrI-like domain-containing protein [Prevotella sp.]
MKHEVITLKDLQIIGMAKEIAFCKGQEECPKFWNEYVERIIKPVVFEKKAPDTFQQAALENGVGEFGLCTCDIPNHNCATCAELNFGTCNNKTFTYVIGGIYKGGPVPEGMKLFPIHSGNWLKTHFEGGMKAFQQQCQTFFKEWLPKHPEFRCAPNASFMEWYKGTDIMSPEYECGVMMPLEEQQE